MRLVPFVFAAALFATQAAAASWNVDHAHSKLDFAVQWSGEPFIATFRKWSAQIDFDPADLAHAKAAVTIDMTSAVSGEADLDQNLPGAQGFDTGRFPQAHFVTKYFRSLGNDRFEAAGELTIRGITKTVTLPFTLNIQGEHAHMKGEATVMRTDFGVGSGDMWAGETPVAHAVKVTVDLTATKAH
jgi:polyisoprenoid-binding protein YceI